MFERFGEKLVQAMLAAQWESRQLGHGYVGTDHILLGLTESEGSISARVLEAAGVDPGVLRDRLKEWHRGGHDVPGPLPLTPETKRILTFSSAEARREGHAWTGTGHLLLGLIADRDNAAVRLLLELGVDVAGLRHKTLGIVGHESEERAPLTIPLTQYVEVVDQSPKLSDVEEMQLADTAQRARKAQESLQQPHLFGDEDVARLRETVREGVRAQTALMAANLGLVVGIARRSTGRDYPLRDLIRRGNLGLEQAVDTFNRQRDEKFSAYAERLIQQGMPVPGHPPRQSRPAPPMCIVCNIPVESIPDAAEQDSVFICPTCAHRFAFSWSAGGA